MFIPTVGDLSDASSSKEQWIKHNPHVCTLPFSVHAVGIEFDGQRDPENQKTFFRNSCCCNLINENLGDDRRVDPGSFDAVKKHIQQGYSHPRCRRCIDNEQQMGSSERSLNLMSMPWRQIQKFVDEGWSGDVNFRIKFSNLCNLACRSCSPTFSSRYAQTYDIAVPTALSKDIAEDPVIWQSITESIQGYLEKSDCLALSLFGGESLIQPGALRLLDWLHDQNLCARINLDITTNFTQLPRQFLDIVHQFRSVSFKASLDSVHGNFEYVRWPAKWNTIQSNLVTVFSKSEFHNVDFVVQPLLNLNNIFYINEILDFWYDWGTHHPDKKFSIGNLMMYRPWHMVIQNLPVRYRSYLGEVISQCLAHRFFLQHDHEVFLHFLQGIIDFCGSTETVYDQFEIFLYETARHDRITKIPMPLGNGKLYDILTDQHKKLYREFSNHSDQNLLPEQQIRILNSLPL